MLPIERYQVTRRSVVYPPVDGRPPTLGWQFPGVCFGRQDCWGQVVSVGTNRNRECEVRFPSEETEIYKCDDCVGVWPEINRGLIKPERA